MKKQNLWKATATLIIAFSIVLSGCGKNDEGISVVPSESPSIIDENSDAEQNNMSALDEESVDPTQSPESDSTLEKSEDEQKPDETLTPTASAKPSATVKPSATSSPKPSATVKPSATSSPKPVPTAKPSATSSPKPVPTAKPSATSSPKPSPTAKPTAPPTASVSTSSIVEKIQADVEIPSVMEVTGDMIKDVYYLESTKYAEASFFRAMMNVKATDLAIIKLKDSADFTSVKEALTKRAEDVIKTFSTYLQDQHEDAKNYQIVQEGDYVLYSISHDQSAVLEAFKAALK